MPLARDEVGSISPFNSLGSALLWASNLFAGWWPDDLSSSEPLIFPKQPRGRTPVSLSVDIVKGIWVQTIREDTSKLTLTSHLYIFAEYLNRLNQVSGNSYWLEEDPVLKVEADTFLCYWCKMGREMG